MAIIGPPALLVGCSLMMAYKEFSARRDVIDYLKLAADAPTLPLAERHLSTAVRNMEARGWTSGNTALIFKVPLRDIGFWYQNTKGALDELEALIATDASLTPVDRSNALVKLRETLMDGNYLTFPEWGELAPYNALFFWMVVAGALGSIHSSCVFVSMMIRWMMTHSRSSATVRAPGWFQNYWRWIDRQAVAFGETHGSCR
jgi:hypothetical protein